ncbi:MAG: ABC transporter permease subunit [Streptosporangiales bacterium]|nr:ABC transporter permease subunit [Streptosporangiales bacterium]
MAAAAGRHAGHRRGGGVLFHAVLAPLTLVWVAPIIFVVLVGLRSFDDLAANGLGSLPRSLTLDGFFAAFTEVELGQALFNSILLTAPAVAVSLLLGSMAAFGLSRYEIPYRKVVLLLMLAGNLLPPQVLLIPVAKMSENIGTYDTILGLVAIHVGFGLGFYTFVLHGFMRGIPREITEAAIVDGASTAQVYWRVVMPLSRPALAALAALATTWIYNDLLWALTVLQSQAKFPITAALVNLGGSYVTQWNVVASGALIAALPTAIVFFAFQRHFVSGLLVGSTK